MKFLRLILLSLLGTTALPASAASPPPPFPPDDGWDELSQLVNAAPSREVGQPGNAAIDNWVATRFQTAVASSGTNIPAVNAADNSVVNCETLLLDAQATAKDAQNVSAADIRPAWQAWIDSNGEMITGILGFSALVLLAGAFFQRRKDAFFLALLCSLLFLVSGAGTFAVRNNDEGNRKQLPARMVALERSLDEARKAAVTASGTGWKTGRISFSAPAFVPGTAKIEYTGRTAVIYQLTANLVDPANLPQGALTGHLVYAGRGEDLGQSGDLSGDIVVLRFDSGNAWIRAAERGCSAVIFLSPDNGVIDFSQAIAKITNSPISLPRYYLPQTESAKLWENAAPLFGSGDVCTLRQEPTRWINEPVGIQWLFIPGLDRSLSPLHYQTYEDSSSIVPELSPGASAAANLVVLDRVIRNWQTTPPMRSVLISVVNTHANALLGERTFAFFAYAPEPLLQSELDYLQRQIAENDALTRIFSAPLSPETVDIVRQDSQEIDGRNFSIKRVLDAAVFKKQFEMRQKNRSTQSLRDLEDAQSVFNRFARRKSWDQLTIGNRQSLAALFQEISSQAEKRSSFLRAERNLLVKNLELRWQTGGTSPALIPSPLNPVALMTLDLQFGSSKAGLFFDGMLQVHPENQQDANPPEERVRPLSRYILNRAQASGHGQEMENTILMDKGVRWQQHLGGNFALAASTAHEYGVAALTLTDVNDQRRWAFTPSDTIASIDRANFDSQMDFADWLLRDLAQQASGLDETRLLRGQVHPVTVDLSVRQLDPYSIDLPDTRVPEALIIGLPQGDPGNASKQPPIRLGEVSPFPISIADEDGHAVLRGVLWSNADTEVFAYDSQFSSLISALDFGDGQDRFSSKLEVTDSGGFYHKPLLCFEARKTDLYGLFNPASFQPLNVIQVLDAQQNAVPRNVATSGVGVSGSAINVPLSNDGTGCILVQPGSSFKLGVGGSPVINATPDCPLGAGFPAGILRLPYIPLVSERDMEFLTINRCRTLERRGVTDASVMRILADAKKLNISALSATPGIDESWGLYFRAYQMTRSTITDLIRAVIIILALTIPFSYFMGLLLTSSTEVTKQLTAFLIVFVLVIATLYLIQPAFGVSDRPIVIILAFVIIGLGFFVAMTIYGRFNDALLAAAQIKDGAGFEAPQSRLLGVSFAVGVNNMKRRRIRSFLTCATVALVTFTMLSVISVKSQIEPLRQRLSSSAPYDGVLLSRSRREAIGGAQVSRLAALATPGALILDRIWCRRFGASDETLPYMVTLAGRKQGAVAEEPLYLEAFVGISAQEPEKETVLSKALISGGRWFQTDNADEILLSRAGASILGLTPDNFLNHQVLVNGKLLAVVGLLEDEEIDKSADLEGFNYAPSRIIPKGPGQQGRQSDDLAEREKLRPRDYAFVPIETARSLGNAEVHSVSIRFDSGTSGSALSAWSVARQAINLLETRIVLGIKSEIPQKNSPSLRAGEYILAPANLSEVGGLLKIMVPTFLGATILLNTMLGSVMERRRDIAIYNSIGLNPTHIIVFFLAESLVFGLVGAFSGYLIGQAISVELGGWLGINLNYSSISVVVVILLSILTVLASTLYPSVLAARSGVPSGKRKWSLPASEGDQMSLQFPFLYQRETVEAVQTYLHQFLMDNSDSSTGKFLAQFISREDVSEGKAILTYRISPTPYDLGVIQTMKVVADRDANTDSFLLSIQLKRVAGELGSWRLVNQVFLENLRHHLLRWRSIPVAKQLEYARTWKTWNGGAVQPSIWV